MSLSPQPLSRELMWRSSVLQYCCVVIVMLLSCSIFLLYPDVIERCWIPLCWDSTLCVSLSEKNDRISEACISKMMNGFVWVRCVTLFKTISSELFGECGEWLLGMCSILVIYHYWSVLLFLSDFFLNLYFNINQEPVKTSK